MTTLTDRLCDLAEDAPAGEGTAGADGTLWARGKRRQRRDRVASSVLAVAVVVVMGTLASVVVDAVGQREAPVADADAELRLPDRLYVASPWTDGTDETGPIGPLVAVVAAVRRSFWGEQTLGVTGVSTTGGYAFLDLPSGAETEYGRDLALSADGRFVGYLITGSTGAEPFTGAGDPVVGVAVYDTVSGETSQQRLETRHGLKVQGPEWIGRTLVLQHAQYVSSGSDRSFRRADLRWDLDTGEVDEALPPSAYPDLARATALGDAVVVNRGSRGFDIVASDGTVMQGPRFDVAMNGPVHVSPDGFLSAGYEDASTPSTKSVGNESLVVADVRGGDAGVTRRVPDTVGDVIVGWRDSEHLISWSTDEDVSGYVTLDVSTGETEPLLELPGGVGGNQPQIAADALSAPSFVAAEPDGPGDPRRMVWLGALLVLLLGNLIVWRRRVRG